MERNRNFTILMVCIALFFLINIVLIAVGHLKIGEGGFGIIVAACLTLAIYSFLYKDNPAFKIAENLFVGVALGYTIIIVWYHVLKPEVYDNLIEPFFTAKAPKYSLLIPTILGCLMLTRFSRKYSWLSRWAFAFVVGLGAGSIIPRIISALIIQQVKPTLRPVFVGGETMWASISTLLILLGVISVLIYFYFSTEHKGAVGTFSRIGIVFLMISFGASFGYTVMARMSLLIGRLQFLLRDWLPILD
ncbi:MAG: hypothetical protein ACUZ77_11885 [Candidatus Brocadiales bacterium]